MAHEFFLPNGPFAILPLKGNRANIVWAEPRAAADALLKMPEADFLAELRRRFGDFLGELSLEGPRFGYPLSLQLAERMIDARVALAGDSAHGIHPLAGQGLNLGLKDCAALAECVADAVALGLDPGDVSALERYQRWRRFDNVSMALGMEVLRQALLQRLRPAARRAHTGAGGGERRRPGAALLHEIRRRRRGRSAEAAARGEFGGVRGADGRVFNESPGIGSHAAGTAENSPRAIAAVCVIVMPCVSGSAWRCTRCHSPAR